MDLDNSQKKNTAQSVTDALRETDLPKEVIDTIGTAYAQNGFSGLVDTNAEKLIDCPREIVFKIEGNVFNQNDEGEIISSEFIFDQSYHIPVPTGIDYKNSMNTFLNHFTSCLEQTSKELWKDHV